MAPEKREFIDPNELMRYINENHSYAGLPMAAHVCTMELLTYAPRVDAIPVTADELKHLINDTIAYLWRLEERGCNKPEFGYDSRKELLQKLKDFYQEHFPELECSDG